ncbi:MAG: hypothetical protein A2W25_01970 [candidate division Zixibacteria bacterium RBG_16_53_22]|nr:MAG: hypothetical protein A2W25_01970 [candidate division Zixibacteria bacterium RBG_16_53_22]
MSVTGRAVILGVAFIFLLAGKISVAGAQEEPLPPEVPFQPIQKLDIVVNPASKARIKFESDTFDFGSIPRGATVVHSFKFANAGQDTLEITSVRPTCGCTTAPLSSNKVAPGDEATIKAYFNSKNFNGRLTKYIYVNSSDPIDPYLKISFKATINDPLLPINMAPLEADFGSIVSGAPGIVKVTLTNAGDSPVDIRLIHESAPEMVKASPTSMSLQPNGNAELTLQLAAQDKSGELKESLTFDITGGQEGRFSLPWKAVITGQRQ